MKFTISSETALSMVEAGMILPDNVVIADSLEGDKAVCNECFQMLVCEELPEVFNSKNVACYCENGHCSKLNKIAIGEDLASAVDAHAELS